MKEKRNSKSCLFALILGINLLFGYQTYAQNCYVRLFDASGLPDSLGQFDQLENASCRLRDSLPAIYQDSFKVFDIGLYLHNENMVGGYPEMFQVAINKAKIQSKYYLIFGRKNESKGLNTQFWVALNLPSGNIFSCMTEGERNFLRLSIDISVNTKYEELSKIPQFYSEAEIFGMEKLWEFFHKQKDCCYQNRGVGCSPICPDSAQIRTYFEKQGFLQRNVSVVFNPNKPDSLGKKNLFVRVNDFAQLSISENGNVRNLSSDAEFLLNGSISCFTNNNCKVFITKNSSLCDLELFLNIQNEFSQTTYDLIGWVHVWQPTESSTEAILFSKFKGKFYENTESFVGEGSHCPGLPYEAYFHVPSEHTDKLNFQKVKENIEKIYKDKNGFKLTVHLEEKNDLTFFDLYEIAIFHQNYPPGSSDWDRVNGIVRTDRDLLYVNIKSFYENNGLGTTIDKKHGEFYIAWVTAHEFLHQISNKSYKIILNPWTPTFYDIGNENIFNNGPHLGPTGDYNLLYPGPSIPNHHNGEYLPRYFSNKVNKFEKINETLKVVMIRSFLSYALFYGTDPNNPFSKFIVEEDKLWLKKLTFSFI